MDMFGFTNRDNHCQCLYEMENNLPRTQHCFMACPAQHKILRLRDIKKAGVTCPECGSDDLNVDYFNLKCNNCNHKFRENTNQQT